MDSGKVLKYPKIIPSRTSVPPSANITQDREVVFKFTFLINQISQLLCIKERDQY